MFYEFNSNSRESFKYPYKGKELVDKAIECRNTYKKQEMEARHELANLMVDSGVSQSDPRLDELRKRIEFNGRQHEACSVFVTGFRREPEREFLLSLGDVVYFGLIE